MKNVKGYCYTIDGEDGEDYGMFKDFVKKVYELSNKEIIVYINPSCFNDGNPFDVAQDLSEDFDVVLKADSKWKKLAFGYMTNKNPNITCIQIQS